MPDKRVIYVVGAGFSAGLGFPTVAGLLEGIWPRLESTGIADAMAEIIRFHHPAFNPSLPDTFVNVEQLLSEMKANEQLFNSSRPATGNFTTEELISRREGFLLQMASWFHEIKDQAISSCPAWLTCLTEEMRRDEAQIISFNWDLVLEELLFGDDLRKSSYAMAKTRVGPRLIKPHGSLNWFQESTGRHIKSAKKFSLIGSGSSEIFAFKPYRAPTSSRRTYMPLIVPPVFNKEFEGPLFKQLWQESVSVLSTASEVRFLGYSMAQADFHARFILRCGFYNQEHGELREDGTRSRPTGRARVVIVNPDEAALERIEDLVGWPCEPIKDSVEHWVNSRS